MRIRLVVNGSYGKIYPGSLLEKLAIIGMREIQDEKVAQTRLLVAASVGAEDKDIKEAFKSYLWTSNPHIHKSQKDQDEIMKNTLTSEADKGAFWIEVEKANSENTLSLRGKPRVKTGRKA